MRTAILLGCTCIASAIKVDMNLNESSIHIIAGFTIGLFTMDVFDFIKNLSK
jgi:hypothetical protein